jgi:hypothetical protein
MHSKNLRAYLDSSAAIAGLLPQAERLVELRRVYGKLVPQQLSRASSVVNYRQQKVVIHADNNAVAAKLRLLTPRLVNDFSKFGVEVTGIRIDVQPRQAALQGNIPKRARLSRAGAQSLEALARQLPDSRLKQALAALAGRAETAPAPDQAGTDDGQVSGGAKRGELK